MFEKKLEEQFRQASLEVVLPGGSESGWVPLSEVQVRDLESRGCSSSCWSGVMVRPGARIDAVINCRFMGSVRMSLLPLDLGGVTVQPLLRDSTLENVELGPGCRVVSVGMLRGLVLEEGALVENCGRVSFSPGALCGCGEELQLGVETGERSVPSFPCLDVYLASILSGGDGRGERFQVYRAALEELIGRLKGASAGRLCRGCRVTDTPVVEDSFIGPGAFIHNATAVRNSTLLEGAGVTDGALVRDSILKWGSMADSLAVVERSILDEASVVEKHGKLTASFLGPNSVLAEGEITASLAGPFTSCHHQALLIAARWPEGRGNIGYGANVGSNHTSRLPDQEIRPGEGMFFGLACSVKFPADFSGAPYSMIATGVTTLPQKVEFPFSLICQPFLEIRDVPPAWNQIVPAWVLSENMFAVRRNQAKFAERNRAVHWKPGPPAIIRRETVELMMAATVRLEVENVRNVYLEDHVPGLGKNFMTEEHRLRAIETYRFHIRLYALEALMEPGDDMSFAGDILRAQFPGISSDGLSEVRSSMLRELETSVSSSRARDHRRGAGIIEDYLAVRNMTGKL